MRLADSQRERERLAAVAAAVPCGGPSCLNPVGPMVRPGPPRRYCSARCLKAAENLRARRRPVAVPVPCTRCGKWHAPLFRDGVCPSCQARQRTIARRKSLRSAVTAKHGNSRCWHCSVSLAGVAAVLDHLVPVTRGGLSTVSNCRWACDACNRAKRSNLPDEWFGRSR
ncbi:HNH endonuclease signature motif containing protein [Streptomyces clavifer]|uniref:HNH endonuclease n=1 Tax=Streptomyces clavifer TaxID=68188 RepID=UPI00099E4F9B